MTHLIHLLRGRRPAKLMGIDRLRRCNAGAAAIEFALVALPFITLVVGIMEFSRVVWTQSAMQFAVEAAARCAIVNTTKCGTTAQIQQYAVSQMFAPGVVAADFSYAPTSTCTNQVSATMTFSFVVTKLLPGPLTLTAQSCYPS